MPTSSLDLALALDTELRVALEAAWAAGAIIEEVAQGSHGVRSKADGSLQSEADRRADESIRRALRDRFPEDGLLSEEEGFAPGASDRLWIVDLLDGTTAFVAGRDEYAVQIGMVDAGEPVLGVVYEPKTGRCYHALRGVGAFFGVGPGTATIRQLRVSKVDALDAMRLTTTSRMAPETFATLREATGLGDGGQVSSVGCKVGRLARREADVYFSGHRIHYWDSCAPLVVLEAAGGAMTFLDGTPLVYDVADSRFDHGRPVVASNGRRHGELCTVLGDALGRIVRHDEAER